LLFDAGRLGIALGHDDATQHSAQLTGNFIPGVLTVVIAESNLVVFGWGQKDAPAIVGHPHVIVVSPTARLDADGSTQPDFAGLEAFRPHVFPPVQEVWLPAHQCSEQLAITAEIHVVRDLVGQCHVRLPPFLMSEKASQGLTG
jgi:hypothetical protein